MTPEQLEVVERVRAAMKVRGVRESRGVSAWRYARTKRVSFHEAAAVFGVTTGAIYGARSRIVKGASKEPRAVRRRAEEAARYVHDSARPTTFAGAAALFAVPVKHLSAAWKRLYPNVRRTRVG